jgi:hypothetical protein
MGSILWAFGAMIITILIVYFIPIGLTKIGKIIVPITGFLLALGGLAAASSFPLWQTLLMLVVLILFVSYIFDQRLRNLLYMNSDDHVMDHSETIEQGFMETAVSHEQHNSETLPVQADILKKKEPVSIPPQMKQQAEAEPAYIEHDDDISFLLNRSITMEKEKSNKREEPIHEVDYLSELEEILLDQREEKLPTDKLENSGRGVLNQEHEIPVLNFNDQTSKKKEESAPRTKVVSPLEGLDEIPVLPFHEKEGK